jgi:branched-chain amino acid transport system substrate-binding protein
MAAKATRVAASKAELIFFPIFAPEGSWICVQMRDVAGLEMTTMKAADGLFSANVLNACGKDVIGMYFSSADLSSFGSHYPIFVNKYLMKYNVKEPLSVFHAYADDAANLIIAAIEKIAVKDPDGVLHIPKQALRDAIQAIRNMNGLTGNITCDPNDDCLAPKIAVYRATADDFSKSVLPSQPVWRVTW